MTPEETIKKIRQFCAEKKYWQEQLYPDSYESETAWQFMDYLLDLCENTEHSYLKKYDNYSKEELIDVIAKKNVVIGKLNGDVYYQRQQAHYYKEKIKQDRREQIKKGTKEQNNG